jgi:tetratricopeptide (TPR) repeat protein
VKQWSTKMAIVLAAVCLLFGIVGGWYVRGGQALAENGAAKAVVAPAPGGNATGPTSPSPDPARLKGMADAQAAPLLAQLKSNPNDPNLLTGIGNLYYDAQQFPIAIDYYARALKAKPADAAVRTDMATAYWYLGNADQAMVEFNKALSDAPNNPNTLFNRGLVKLRGKMDPAGALADFHRLLQVAPNYPAKDKVEQMIAEAKTQGTAKSGTNVK